MSALGRHHPRLKAIARLHEAAERRAAGQFLVEGVRALEDLEASGFPLLELLVGAPSERGQALVRRLAPRTSVLGVEPRDLERISPGETSQGLLGVAAIPEFSMGDLLRGPSLLICEGVSDPGNLGTLIRTARATGTGGVLTLGGCDPYGPKTVRAAAGAFFSLPIRAGTSADLEEVENAGFGLVATVVQGGEDLFQAGLPARPAWLLGSEAHGLSEASLGRVKHRVSLPMQGGESLNVAICGAVTMFEWVRRSQLRA